METMRALDEAPQDWDLFMGIATRLRGHNYLDRAENVSIRLRKEFSNDPELRKAVMAAVEYGRKHVMPQYVEARFKDYGRGKDTEVTPFSAEECAGIERWAVTFGIAQNAPVQDYIRAQFNALDLPPEMMQPLRTLYTTMTEKGKPQERIVLDELLNYTNDAVW